MSSMRKLWNNKDEFSEPKLTLGSFPGLPGSPGLPCVEREKTSLHTI